MKFSKWHIAPAEEADIRRLGEAGYPQLVSQVLAARGISTAEEAAAFLERGRDLTCSPFLMKDMDRAVECISRAISQGRRIAVFGDYDVDGITATVILVDYLKSRGVDVLHYIPRRIEDGYGLGQDAIRSLHEQGVELLITVDCGITGVEEVDFAASLGMDVALLCHIEHRHNDVEGVGDHPNGNGSLKNPLHNQGRLKICHVVMFCDHLNQFITGNEGQNDASNRQHHIAGQSLDHGENARFKIGWLCADLLCDAAHLCIDIIKQAGQIGHDGRSQQRLDPI